MANYIHGKKAAVLHGGLNFQPWMREGTAKMALDPADTSHWGLESKTYIAGLNDATFSGNGLYDGTLGGIQDYFETVIASEQAGGAAIPLTFAPEGVTTIGAVTMLANAKTTSYEVNAVISDVVSMAFEMQADGGMSGGVLLTTATPVGTTTAFTSVDNLALTSNGGQVNVHFLSNANTGNVTATLQHSTNNSTWVDLVILPVVTTGTLTASRTATFTGTVNRYLRINLTLAGTGSVSVVASASRK